jgi:transposase
MGFTARSRGWGTRAWWWRPSLIPKRPGDRVKTNRRDALSLARQLRAGELTAVWVPDPRHEAMRDLTRARGAAVVDLRSKHQQVSGFLLRLGRHYSGKKTWTKAHMTWLAGQKLEHAEQRIAFEEMLLAVRQAEERVARLEAAIRAAVPDWSLAAVVEALMAMRGIDMIAATAFLAEIGDLSRFQTPRELMGYLGLVPSEHSTGDTIKRGPITKAGNRRARRVLVESAWSYRHPPRVGKDKQAKVAAAPPAVRAIAWKAQHRLYGRYRALVRKGKLKTVAITAIARELAGFIWAVSRELTMTASVAAR